MVPCPSCGANLHIVSPWDVQVVVISSLIAAALLWIKHVILWGALLLWLPLTFIITMGLFLFVAILDLDRLESDTPHGPPPGSTLGLGS